MQRIHDNCQATMSPWRGQTSKTTAQEGQVATTQLTQISSSQDVVLNLTTSEGDEVSISLAARSLSNYLDYQQTGQDNEGSYAGQLQMSSTESELDYTMTVEGDLNDEELKDIGRALKTIDKMMSNFVQGRMVPMMANADKLSRLGTISDLSLEMSYSRDVLIAQQTEVRRGSDPLGTTYDSQGQLTETRPAIAPEQPASTPGESQLTAEADALSTAMAKRLNHVREFADRFQDSLKRIFDRHHKHAQELNPRDVAAPSLIDRIHQDLLAKMRN